MGKLSPSRLTLLTVDTDTASDVMCMHVIVITRVVMVDFMTQRYPLKKPKKKNNNNKKNSDAI